MHSKIILYFSWLVFLVDISYEIPCSAENDNNTLLETLTGKVQGSCSQFEFTLMSKTTKNRADIISWLSIPFAEPPMNENRFKAPIPIKKWTGVLDGTVSPYSCLQISEDGDDSTTSEDCLYLNVYVTASTFKNRSTSLKPVLVWIYGGSFVSGSASDYNPDTLVGMQDIIVVTINYRLNALGFLHLSGESDASGNQALLDQYTALKWISENAATFGGDNSKITISGESAGAWSVGYQLFIPASWRYFRNAIMQSGGPTGVNNAYSLLSSETATKRARLLFSFIGCNLTTNSESLKCAKSVSQAKILEAYNLLDKYMIKNQSKYETEIFLPTIDNLVFNKSIDELARQGSFKNCNIITGYNSDIASLFTLYVYLILGSNSENYIEEAEAFNYEKFMSFLQKLYKYFPFYSQQTDASIINAMVQTYFTASELANITSVSSTELIRRVNRIFSDQQYVCQAYDMARVYSSLAYVYKYQYRLETSLIPAALVEYFGLATHADELDVTFGSVLTDYADFTSDADKQFAQDVLTYWGNFVKYNNPNGLNSSLTRWDPFLGGCSSEYENGKTIVFYNSGYQMQTGFSEHKCIFWNSPILPGVVTTTRATTTTSTMALFNGSQIEKSYNFKIILGMSAILGIFLFEFK